MDLATRFWTKVSRPSEPDECWLWQAGLAHGYGSFRVGDRATGRSMQAHRMAWELVNGPIPKGKHVLHHCDVKRCCNPAHLYVGTNVENARDRVERGQQNSSWRPAIEKRKPGWNRKRRDDDGRRGGNRPRALTDDQVHEARRRYAAGETYQQIAESFGCTKTPVMWAVRGVRTYAGI